MKLVEVVKQSPPVRKPWPPASSSGKNAGKSRDCAGQPGLYRQPSDDTFYFERDSEMTAVLPPKKISMPAATWIEPPMGPLALADLIGLTQFILSPNAMYAELKDPQFVAPTLLGKMVTAGWLAARPAKVSTTTNKTA